MRKSILPSLCVLIFLVLGVAAIGQTEAVLYSFGTNPNDGNIPNGNLISDKSGNLYGTTQRGGLNSGGTVFELSRGSDGSWTETILYNFCSQSNCADGGVPLAGVVFDAAGNLYGTAAVGGTYSGGTCNGGGCGTVFELSPPSAPGGAWSYTVLWDFRGNLNSVDGAEPSGTLAWDADGDLYGTTEAGGNKVSRGTVFELSPISGGGWSEKVLYIFCANGSPCSDGAVPVGGVTALSKDLYGTTNEGAFDGKWGTAYRLSPLPNGSWNETTIYRFSAQSGGQSTSNVSFDKEGNLYGTASAGGQGCGGIWKLSPRGQGVRIQTSPLNGEGANGCTPDAGILVDSRHETLYGTASSGGAFNGGTIFKVGTARQEVLYNFCQQSTCFDGDQPTGLLTPGIDALYGATSGGGEFNQGVIFEITQ